MSLEESIARHPASLSGHLESNAYYFGHSDLPDLANALNDAQYCLSTGNTPTANVILKAVIRELARRDHAKPVLFDQDAE